jgi:flagellar basal-body rod modification protein FlgD
MSTVNPVASTTNTQSGSGIITNSTQEMGKTEFLRLLVTQLQNQDPLNPMDNQQFIAQLATFSSLEQLISINTAVSKLAGTDETNNNGNNSQTPSTT